MYGKKISSVYLIDLNLKEKYKMINKRRNTQIKANAPIVELMNLIWGL